MFSNFQKWVTFKTFANCSLNRQNIRNVHGNSVTMLNFAATVHFDLLKLMEYYLRYWTKTCLKRAKNLPEASDILKQQNRKWWHHRYCVHSTSGRFISDVLQICVQNPFTSSNGHSKNILLLYHQEVCVFTYVAVLLCCWEMSSKNGMIWPQKSNVDTACYGS